VLACASIVAGCATGCRANEDEQTLEPVVLGMTSSAAPFYRDNQTAIYQVTIPVRLPMRRPTDDEARGLGQMPPYPRAPFLKSSDVRIEVRFTLTNVDDKRQSVELLLDPWNEFVRYRPGLQVSDEDALPNYSGYQKSFMLDPKQRLEGIVTADDTLEMAIDLATAMNIAANPPPADAQLNAAALMNRAFNLQNRSNQPDPAIGPLIPPVIPGLTGFDLSLRTRAPENVAVEITTDVRDLNGDRVVPPGETARTFGPPGRVLSPPASMN
jgi:hypothetical protein